MLEKNYLLFVSGHSGLTKKDKKDFAMIDLMQINCQKAEPKDEVQENNVVITKFKTKIMTEDKKTKDIEKISSTYFFDKQMPLINELKFGDVLDCTFKASDDISKPPELVDFKKVTDSPFWTHFEKTISKG